MSKSKIPLLLLHGALGSKNSFSHLVPYVEERYHLIIPDLPGHGNNPGTNKRYSMDYLSDFLYEYLKSVSPNEIFVFGYSLGGYLALFHESRYPGSFVKIITMATKFDWNQGFAEIQRESLIPEALKEKAATYYAGLHRMHAGNVDELLWSIISLMEELGKEPPINQDLIKSLKTPVLFTVGDKDKMVSIDETKQVSSFGELTGFSVLENTSHPIEKLNPEILNSLLNFLES